MTVVVRKRIGAENQTDADKYNNETKPVITGIGGLVTVDAKADGAGDHAVETDLDISVPRKASVTVTSHRGDVSIAGRDGNVDISAQRSDTSVEEVTGSVKISQDRGTVRVQQITGDVHVGNRLNEVSVSDAKGRLQLEGEFQESVRLSHIGIKNQHEEVEIRKGSAVAMPAAAPVPPVPPKPGKALAAPKGSPQPTDN